MREALVKALSGFAGGEPLRDCAAGLFGALGYRSERTAEIGSVDEFIELLESNGRQFTDRQRTRFDGWRNVEIVFQFTCDEIATSPGVFDKSNFERGRADSFLFLAVDVASGTCARTRLIEITRAVNSRFAMPVILLFRHGSTLTLAVVHRRPNRRDAARDVLEKVTLIKDIRFERPHRAHIEILADLALPGPENIRNFDELHAAWETALDIEGLNRRFYKELFRWFERAVEQCRFPDDGAGAGSGERHVIRLITRLLFIWFLKEKGLVPPKLFEERFAKNILREHTPDRTDYYRAVLQNLFFATLNAEIGKRGFQEFRRASPESRAGERYLYRGLLTDPDGFVAMLRSVPFVNGGLFDCLDEPGRLIDDYAEEGWEIEIPSRLFFDAHDGLFSMFGRYKFTVEENTPLDQEVALDPELLGRVFENLLAAYNPETRDTARHATGSYYTPRHIVDYMVDEALLEVLAENRSPSDDDPAFWRERLRYLLDYEDAFDDARELFDRHEAEAVVRAVANLRVLDPAVGSGAFPMGVLHKLTLVLRRLDPGNTLWEELQKARASIRAGAAFDEIENMQTRERELMDISRTFEIYRESDFGRKLYLIQNGLYGVDIQPVACQITKLRFFISLVVEQRMNDDPNRNYGIRPLPNLETRFVAADALTFLRNESVDLLVDDEATAKQREVAAVRERYFLADSRRKKHECVAEEERLRDELRKLLDARREDWVAAQKRDIERKTEALENPKDRQKFQKCELTKFDKRQRAYDRDFADACNVAEWDPYDQNARAGWFDPGWMFGVTGGFDVVIGNPPYVQLQKDGGRAGDMYEGADYKTFVRTGDIYQLFYERGCGLLRPDTGTLAYITSNSWLKAKYGEPLRRWLAGSHTPLRLVEMGKDVFDAIVDAAVLLVREGGSAARMPAVVMDWVDGQDLPNATERWGEARPNGEAPWSILSAAEWRVLDKMKAKGTPLKDWNVRINYGVKTGYNDAFIVDSATREALIAEDSRSQEILKPVLRGRDLQRWRARWAGKWLIDTHNGYGDISAIDVADHPAIKRHLDRYLPALKQRQDKGRTPYNLRNCAYHEDFAEEKLFWIDLTDHGRFAYDSGEVFALNSAYVLVGKSIKFLCSVLNSRLATWFMNNTAVTSGMGVTRWIKTSVSRIPIPEISAHDSEPFVRLVDDILAAKDVDADTSEQEKELDRMIYALYDLTGAEISAVQNERS